MARSVQPHPMYLEWRERFESTELQYPLDKGLGVNGDKSPA